MIGAIGVGTACPPPGGGRHPSAPTGSHRLPVGEVSENEDQVNAGMVTMNGSLVERYAVDKRTGAWRRELARFRIDRSRSSAGQAGGRMP